MKAKDLKNSILQMAVEGKLVPQNPADEPASVLLERIREERRKLVAEKKIKTPKGGESIIYLASDGSRYEKRIDAKGRESKPVCIDDEIPFDMPDGWEWCRFCSVIMIDSNMVQPENYLDSPHIAPDSIVKEFGRLLGYRTIREDGVKSPKHLFHKGQILYSKIRPALRKAVIAPCEGLCSADMYALSTPLNAGYVLALLLSDYFTREVLKDDTRVKMPKTNQTALGIILLPVPPLAEQRRIAARVAGLMPLVEEYGRLEGEREALDAALPERLRKSILQEAVRGRLVPQDPADEPASKLLARIREERAAKVAAGELKAPKGGESVIYRASDGAHYEKRGKGEPVCVEDEIPFDLPEGWEWARLGSLCAFGKCNNIEYKDIPDGTWVLELEDVERDNGCISVKRRKNGGSGSTKHSFKAGDILYSKLRPYLNKVVIADEDGASTSEILPLRFNGLNTRFMQITLMAPMFLDYAKSCSYGVKMPRLGTNDGAKALIPIPPLAEQRRIAAKVDELTALTSQLPR